MILLNSVPKLSKSACFDRVIKNQKCGRFETECTNMFSENACIRVNITVKYQSMNIQHTHTRLTALFRDYPGEPVSER